MMFIYSITFIVTAKHKKRICARKWLAPTRWCIHNI